MDCPCSNFYINVQTQKYHIVKTTSQSAAQMGEYEIIDDFGGHAKCMAEKMCMESQLEETAAFIDLNTLEERLAGKNSIIHEFIDKKTGWCRSRFIPVDYDENGRLLHVLFCIECIEEEKKRENRLIYLAQTDLMTGLYNRGSGERQISHLLQEKTGGLLCLIDCDKFKKPVSSFVGIYKDNNCIAFASLTLSIERVLVSTENFPPPIFLSVPNPVSPKRINNWII